MNIINIIIACVITYSVNGHAEDEFEKINFKETPLTKSLYMLEGAGGNITASIGSDGVLLVDDDFAEMSEKLVIKLKELGGNTPRYIINTHFHYDHTGGNKNFGKTATIIAASEVRKRLMSEQTLWRTQHPAFESTALPILTYDQSLMMNMNEEDIKILHLSHGHTDGDTIVFFNKNKVVSLGDLYFSGMYPIFHPEHDGGLDRYIKNIRSILDMIPSDTKIVPGHGPLSNKQELQRYYDMILDSVAVVQEGVIKGHSLEQIQKNGLPPKWESFSHGYLSTNKWIEILYKNIKKGTNEH